VKVPSAQTELRLESDFPLGQVIAWRWLLCFAGGFFVSASLQHTRKRDHKQELVAHTVPHCELFSKIIK
jgi:hypothetical protein